MPNISIDTLESLLKDAKELEAIKKSESRPLKEPVCTLQDPNFPVTLKKRLQEAFGSHYCRGMRRLINEGLAAHGH